MSNQVDSFDNFERSLKTNARRGIVAWAVIALSGVAVVVAGIVGYVATDSVKTGLLAVPAPPEARV